MIPLRLLAIGIPDLGERGIPADTEHEVRIDLEAEGGHDKGPSAWVESTGIDATGNAGLPLVPGTRWPVFAAEPTGPTGSSVLL
jgi:hypothetical protein